MWYWPSWPGTAFDNARLGEIQVRIAIITDIHGQDDAVFGKSHRKGADSIVDANTGVTDAWIVKVQKTINQGALRLEGNKLISVAVQP